MSFKIKLVSAIATGFAVVSFSALAASAQTEQQTTQPQDSAQQTRREHKGFGKADGEGHRHHGGGEMGMRELAQLNLTDAQKQQIHAVMEANRKNENSADFQEIRTLSQAKRSGTITPEQEQKLKAFKKQMRANMEQTHQQILAILTTEQRAQLEQIEKQRREEMKQRRETREQNGKPTNGAKKDDDGDN